MTENNNQSDQSTQNAKTNDELVSSILHRDASCQSFFETLKTRYESNKNYWKGNQIDKGKLKKGESDIVVNRVFTATETIIPIASRRTPEPVITITPRDNESYLLQDKIFRHLRDEWEIHDKMQQKSRIGLRNMVFAGYMIGKLSWNDNINRSVCKVLHPNSIYMPEGSEDIQNAPYLIEHTKFNLKDIQEDFGDDAYNTIKSFLSNNDKTVDDYTKVEVIEYWENDQVIWIHKPTKTLLKQSTNPTYEFEKKEQNHFPEPHKPYFLMNLLNTGENYSDDTTLVEQVKPIQDNINKRKRQIDTNAEYANGKYVVAGGAMDADNASAISYDTHVIYLDKAQSTAGAIDILMGRALDQGTYQDMSDSKQEVDNIMGTHSTTRGERDAQETAAGRTILKDSDYGRIDLITTNYEQFAEDYFNLKMQLLKVNAPDKLPIISIPDGVETKKISELNKHTYLYKKELVNKQIVIMVKAGSTAPKDKIAEQQQAIELASKKMMSLKDMYKILEYANPDKMARNAIIEQTNPLQLYPEIQNPNMYDPDAIRHIRSILDNGETGDPKIDLYNGDINNFPRHIDTHTEYLKGVDIDETLPDIKTLDINSVQMLLDHIEKEKINMEEMANEEMAKGNLPLPPEQVGGQLPPTEIAPPNGQPIPQEALMQVQANNALPPQQQNPSMGLEGVL